MSKKNPVSEISRALREKLLEFLVGAFSFAAALFWRDAIVELINTYKSQIEMILPFKGVLVLKFAIALFVSVFSVLIIYFLTKFLKE